MQINHSRYNVNFGSNPLYKIKLGDGTKAKFAEVFPQNPYDDRAVVKVLKGWDIKDKTHDYLEKILTAWEDRKNGGRPNMRHFIVELVEKGKPLSERIVAIAYSINPKSILKNCDIFKNLENQEENLDLGIFYLQSKNSAQNVKKIGGAGEALMYGFVRLAKKYDFQMLDLFSKNDSFYEKIGLKTKPEIFYDPSFYILEKEDYNPFISRVEKKYGFKN